jgi:hypothetical protein
MAAPKQAESPILGKSLGNIICDQGSVQSVEHCKAAMEIWQEAIAITEQSRMSSTCLTAMT